MGWELVAKMGFMSMGTRIKARREELGVTQEALAEVLGVSRESVRLWENDEAAPRRDRLADIANALKTSPRFLLIEEEPERQPARPVSPKALHVGSLWERIPDEAKRRELFLEIVRYTAAAEDEYVGLFLPAAQKQE
jgi:transcriptional regulator with XRE-family HTH domain